MASYRSIFIVFFLATHFHLLHCLQRVPNLQVAVDPYNEAADTSPEPETTGDGKRKKKGSKEKESKKKQSTKGGSKPKNDRPLVSHSVVLQLMPTYDGAPRDIPWDQLVAILYKAFFEMKGLPETWPRQSMCIMHIGHEIFLASSVEGPTEKWLAKEGPAELMKADLRLNVGSRHRRGGRCCELNVLRLYFENPALQRGDDNLRRAKFAAAGPKLDKNKNPIPGTVEVYTPCPDEHFSGRFGCQTMFNTLNSRPPNDRIFASIEPLKNKDNIAPAPGIDDDILITPINYRQIAKTRDEFGPDLFSNEDLSQFDPKKVPDLYYQSQQQPPGPGYQPQQPPGSDYYQYPLSQYGGLSSINSNSPYSNTNYDSSINPEPPATAPMDDYYRQHANDYPQYDPSRPPQAQGQIPGGIAGLHPYFSNRPGRGRGQQQPPQPPQPPGYGDPGYGSGPGYGS